LTSEQLEVSRAERLRLNGNGALTLEDARTWIEETGLCLFLPRRQFSIGVAPSFVEAIAGHRNPTPDPNQIALAEQLLVRLENDGVAVRLNLLGQPGEQPDFVVAAWVLPYVYALRGDRDWRRSPQLTGSRQVSPLAIQAYKLLEAGDATIPQLKHTLGREVTEMAVLRAITELWQQLRIIPVIAAPGKTAQWQLLRHRFQKAIAEGASTSQVTAISVLASIYLQAVIAASMEEVELFLAPLTARSKIREVLRGLVATRQVHTLSMGHAPQFYVAGTLPEFSAAPTMYASSAMAASAYFLHARDHDEPAEPVTASHAPAAPVVEPRVAESRVAEPRIAAETHASRMAAAATRKPASNGKPAAARPHFSRPAARTRDRKPAQAASASRPARRPSRDARTPASPRAAANGTRHTSGTRWTASSNGNVNGNGHNANGRNGNGHQNGHANGHSNGHSNGRSAEATNGAAHGTGRGTNHASNHGSSHTAGHTSNHAANRANGNGHSSPRNGARPAHAGKSVAAGRSGKASPASRTQRNNGRTGNGKPAAKPAVAARKDARGSSKSRKPALTAGAKAGNSKRYGFTAPAKQGTKKRG
jgi:hypothetical protein